MQFQEYLAAILDLCKLGGVAGVGKLDTLDFLITWTPRNTNMQKNQFGQAMPTGAHFLTIRTYTISRKLQTCCDENPHRVLRHLTPSHCVKVHKLCHAV